MTDFDHAVINVLGQMDEAAAHYERLGFTLTPRGYHTLGSINHLAVFGESYLELLGYAPGEREKRSEMWEHPAGLTGLAFRTGDAAALHDELQANGVPVEQYKDFSRPVEIDGEEKTASFRTFQVARGEVANGRIFFCQHNTPELIWRSRWQTHPNGACGIAAATIASRDPARLASIVGKVPGVGVGLRAGRTTLHIIHPDEFTTALPAGEALPELEGGAMRMVALDVFTTSLETTAAFLAARGVRFLSDNDAIVLPPEEAMGLVLRFVPER